MYGIPLLISGTLYDIFSKDVQKYCRKIDVVTIKGNSKPISLYTSDCDFSHFILGQFTSRRKELYARKNKFLKKKLEKGEVTTGQIFAKSHELALMRRNFAADFFISFKTGMKFYLAGEWVEAKTYFEKSLDLKNKDGPSLCIQSFMKEYNFQCPSIWKNYRPLG
ncbi:hypothetical protein SteCoe_28226 [Stentor coeruleus]|uniref:Uncharacterized protein n=1 Tax=Stentor coeruleus TaxID=5963 RepID=A0A1R2B8T2_9CILI|nr:hypothetical protein SteCoe_28226 [Stentor coeruleus]